MKKRLFLTGATGNLGRAIARQHPILMRPCWFAILLGVSIRSRPYRVIYRRSQKSLRGMHISFYMLLPIHGSSPLPQSSGAQMWRVCEK